MLSAGHRKRAMGLDPVACGGEPMIRTSDLFIGCYRDDGETGSHHELLRRVPDGVPVTIKRFRTSLGARRALIKLKARVAAGNPRKRVYPTAEIPHLWAHRALDDAKNPSGNLFFVGEVIYSYGHHFPIARWAERKGKRAILFNSASYSHTTAQHQHAVRMAIPPGVPVFNGLCNDDQIDLTAWRREYEGQMTRLQNRIARSRSRRASLLAEMQGLRQEAQAFYRFFGVKAKLPKLPSDWDSFAKLVREAEAANKKRLAEALAKRQAKVQKELAEPIAKWREGDIPILPAEARELPTVLRLRDGMVETSLGASVPAPHAARALQIIRALMTDGKLPWQSNGHCIRLGHYKLDSIERNGTIHAGCHVIPWVEVERIAPALERIQPAGAEAMQAAGGAA